MLPICGRRGECLILWIFEREWNGLRKFDMCVNKLQAFMVAMHQFGIILSYITANKRIIIIIIIIILP